MRREALGHLRGVIVTAPDQLREELRGLPVGSCSSAVAACAVSPQTIRHGWRNEIEGEAVLSTHATRGEAVDAGREGARRRQTEHVIHNSDGSIGERNSYGSDRGDVSG